MTPRPPSIDPHDLAFVEEYLRKLFGDRECPHCHKQWEGEQRGRCVYCEHCGTRLFQGEI